MCALNVVSHRENAFILLVPFITERLLMGREESNNFAWEVCDTAGLLFDVNMCVPVHSVTKIICYLRKVSVTKTLRSHNVVEFSCTIIVLVLAEEATS